MDHAQFSSVVDASLLLAIGPLNFKRTGPGLWNRRTDGEFNVVSLQRHRTEAKYCVNLGIHYSFLPKAGTEAPISGDALDPLACEIKLRLTSDPSANDQWWPPTEEAATEIGDLACLRGLAVFDSYRLTGPISSIDAEDIEVGAPTLLSVITKVRACLLLARFHEHFGDRDKCIDAATRGIRLAGMAVGPKKALKEILKRCEQSA